MGSEDPGDNCPNSSTAGADVLSQRLSVQQLCVRLRLPWPRGRARVRPLRESCEWTLLSLAGVKWLSWCGARMAFDGGGLRVCAEEGTARGWRQTGERVCVGLTHPQRGASDSF